MSPKRDPYQLVTDKIIAALERGVAPWVKPWHALAGGGTLRNALSKRPYHGINVWLLASEGRADPRWLTFRQAKQLGGSVRRGEHGTQVVFWKMLRREEEIDGEKSVKTFPMLRLYTLFNVEQCDIDLGQAEDRAVLPEVERDAVLEDFLRQTGANIRPGGTRAAFSPVLDYIMIPRPETFCDTGAYYATLLHELTHWTGHPSRLDRTFGRRFGDLAYAAEELVAEMGSAFLCQRFEVDGKLQHPQYIGNWLKALRDDKRAVFTAASAARKACQLLYERSGYPDLAEAEEVAA